MAGTSLTSTISVKLIDDVSKPARTVAQALKDAERAAKAAAKGMAETKATDRFVKSLAGLKLSAKDIEAVAASWKDFAKAQDLADDASRWTKQQIADVRAWERAQLAALREVKREQMAFYRETAAASRAAQASAGAPVGLIGGMSAAGAANLASIRAREEIAAAGKRISSGMSSAGRVAESEATLFSPGAAAALGAVAGKFGHVLPLAGGFATYEVLHKAAEAAAERQHVVTGARLAGMRETELTRAEARAKELAGGGLTLSGSEVLELFKEGRSAVQHPEEMFELIKPAAEAASVLKGMGVENAHIADLIKAGESLGLMNDPKRFRTFLEGQVKAMQVFGRTITTEQIYEAATYSKSAGATLSDRFLNAAMPSLIQEMHGAPAGTALSMLGKTLRGGLQNRHLSVQLLNSLGLLEEPDKIVKAKGSGEIKGYSGKIRGNELLASDPDLWAYKIFKPAAERAGYRTLAQQIELLTKILPSTAANVVRIFLQQQHSIEAHGRNLDNATGLEASLELQHGDPKAALKELAAAWDDFAAALLKSAPVGGVLHALAEGLRSLAAIVDHYMMEPKRWMDASQRAEQKARKEGRKSNVIDLLHEYEDGFDKTSFKDAFDKYRHSEQKHESSRREIDFRFRPHPAATPASPTTAEQKPTPAKDAKDQKIESSDFWSDFWKKAWDGFGKTFGVSGAHAATLPDSLRFRPGYGRNALLRHAHIGAGSVSVEAIRRADAEHPRLPKVAGKQLASLVETVPGITSPVAPSDIPGFGGSRSWRNNNPGNLRYGEFAAAHGATGKDEKGFAVFPDAETGRAAQRSLLFDTPQYAGLSIREAIGKYAPAAENDTGAYVRRVTNGLGVGPEARLADLAPEQREHMLDIMREHEGWRPAYRARAASDAPAPAGTRPVQEGTTTVVTKGGRKLTVDARYAENFRGFLNDYEAAGGVVGPNSGGLGVRPGNASYHPIGRAIDVNQIGRNIRAGGVTLPVEVENRLASKWGLRSGANFRSPDAGHFEVNDAFAAHEALKANGVIAKDAPAPAPPPLDQRALTDYLFGDRKAAREVAAKARTSAQMMQEVMTPPASLSTRGNDGEIDGALGESRGARDAWGSPIKARADISEIHAMNDALRESIRLRERLHNIGGGGAPSGAGRPAQSGRVSMQSFDQIRRGGYSTGGGQGDW
ncbi:MULTISPECIES: hypothetical protein [Methylosinus]|uniref:Uncharacterized protein n=1 Tax=Methylosinus trichosporium (strain ATCC 35070 / NCIMB 11131 / UNIQEM 75 / OB3b) TaxID=595536 RepID=A0A2D2CYL8_METT3|nr:MULTISPECIES: hypothetical protein [Methylosinus]ATQ67832.1 hypothetical protein CQW49_07930 [Methylosinus trichosporium OB3b]OBS51852.1 hypothetical protein A8B73_14455 [Methylosinus sp. 3S-1]